MGFSNFINVGTLPRYYDTVMRGRCFTACNTGVLALSVNSATATGMILSNPVTSGVNMVLLQAGIALASAPAAQSNIIWTGTLLTTANANTTHTTPLLLKNLLIGSGGAASACLADSSATVPTPAAIRSVGGGPVAASSISPGYIMEELAGIIILSPGCVISVQAVTTAISAQISVVWEEVPV